MNMYQRCNWCSVFNPSVWAFTQVLYVNRPHKTSTSWTTIFPPIFGTLEVTSPAFSSWNFPGKPHHKGWSDWKKNKKQKCKTQVVFAEGPKRTFPSFFLGFLAVNYMWVFWGWKLRMEAWESSKKEGSPQWAPWRYQGCRWPSSCHLSWEFSWESPPQVTHRSNPWSQKWQQLDLLMSFLI